MSLTSSRPTRFVALFSACALSVLSGFAPHAEPTAVAQVHTAEEGMTNCADSIRSYIEIIDGAMSAERIDAYKTSLTLKERIPKCRIEDEKILFELAKESRFFLRIDDRGTDIVSFRFRTTANDQDFHVHFAFDRKARLLVAPGAIHRNKF